MRDLMNKPHASRSFGKKRFITIGAVIAVLLLFVFIKNHTTIVNLITDGGLKSDNNRVNVLLLGIGGEGHDGPNLTDTMIVASIDKKGKDVALVNIPRDLWVPENQAKINAAYAAGQEKNGKGLAAAEKTVSNLFGVPIHYGVRLDFNGFEKAINLIGGLDINVENSFVDTHYPIAGKENDTCGIEVEEKGGETYFIDATGSAQLLTEENNPFDCRYEMLKFTKGLIHMDGATALKYVRSRHGTNGENSDFARSARQEKVLTAFRQKVFSSETLLNPKKLLDLANTFGRSIDTDIHPDEVPLLLKLAQRAKAANIRRIVLDSGRPDSLLDEGDPNNYFGAFVLIPKNNKWQELAEYIQGEIFKNTQTLITPSPKTK
jgi:LCP family protein required for cell wall assembly